MCPAFHLHRRPAGARTLRAALALVVLAFSVPAAFSGAQEGGPGVPAAPSPWTAAEVALTADLSSPAGDLPRAADLEAVWDGRRAAVTAAAAIEVPWAVTVYVDPALLTPSGLQDAAAALARRSEALTALGPVEIRLAEAAETRSVAAGGEPAPIRQRFERLADEGGIAGELAELRYELLDAAEAGGAAGAATDLAARLLGEERRLLARARQSLLDVLAGETRGGPRLLLWVSDGFDLDPAEFYGRRVADPDALAASDPLAPPVAAAWEELSRAAAAAGWLIVPVAMGDPGPVLRAPLQPLSELAEATGGRVARSDRDLPPTLAAIAARAGLRVVLPADPSGIPRRLEITRRGGAAVGAARWAAAAPPLALSAARARAAALRPLREMPAPPLLAHVHEDRNEAGPDLELVATVAPRTGSGGGQRLIRLSVYYDLLDAPPIVQHELFSGPPGVPLRLELSTSAQDPRLAGVAVEEISAAGGWTAARATIGDEAPRRIGGAVAAVRWAAPSLSPPDPALTASAAGAAIPEDAAPQDAPPAAAQTQVPAPAAPPPALPPPGPTASRPPVRGRTADRAIALLPPRRAGFGRLGGNVSGNPTGKVRLETLVTRPDIVRVVFYLDGREVAADDREPFTAVVDLGSEARPRTLRADALSAAGRVLGSSEVQLAAATVPFRVLITEVAGDAASGALTVEAAVTVPADGELARVEWYFNQTLSAEQPAAAATTRYRARVATPDAGPNDFLRVAAYLTDGTSIEDARLLSAPGESDRVAVNLVELFAVVTDRAGTPLTGLGSEDFTVRLGGEELPVERFRLADEVPLLLGLLVDTSESMWPLLPDTKRAAAKFLADTLREDDRAFLVSFDDQPRLVRQPTADLLELLSGFGALRATGRTALYDAIVFSLLQMEDDRGRRALVLLTDGRDWGSRYGPRRATEYGRTLGVPVYVLSFGDLYGDRRPLPQPDLDAVTARTGGQVFYIQRLEELAAVYARIAEELRSQYILAVATDRQFSADELSQIDVDAGRGRRVRAAVGGSDLN